VDHARRLTNPFVQHEKGLFLAHIVKSAFEFIGE